MRHIKVTVTAKGVWEDGAHKGEEFEQPIHIVVLPVNHPTATIHVTVEQIEG